MFKKYNDIKNIPDLSEKIINLSNNTKEVRQKAIKNIFKMPYRLQIKFIKVCIDKMNESQLVDLKNILLKEDKDKLRDELIERIEKRLEG